MIPWKHPLAPVPNCRCIVVPLEYKLENLDEIERLPDAEREQRLKQALQDLDDQRKDAQ